MKRLCIFILLVAGLTGLSSSMSGGSRAAPTAWAYLHLKVAGVAGSVAAYPPGTQTSLDSQGNCPDGVCVLAYPAGTQVTLTPTTFGGSFVGWYVLDGKPSPGVCGNKTVCTFPVNGSLGIKAAFSPVELSFASTSGGWVEVLTPGSPCGKNCYRYQYGSLVRIRAHTNEGFSFYGWYGHCEGIGEGCRFNIDDNVRVSAIFSCNFSPCTIEQPVTKLVPVTLDVRGPGSIVYGRGRTCSNSRCPVDVAKKSLLSLEAKPTNPAGSVAWSGVACPASGTRCSFPVSADSRGKGPTVYVSFR